MFSLQGLGSCPEGLVSSPMTQNPEQEGWGEEAALLYFSMDVLKGCLSTDRSQSPKMQAVALNRFFLKTQNQIKGKLYI